MLEEIFAYNASLKSQDAPVAVLEGVLQAGSYDPTNGTVQVVIGHTVAAAGFDDGDQPMIVTASLATVGYGDQYGPIGNERALVLRAGTHYIAFIEFGPDDSPGVPSGERWIVHRNPQTGDVDAIVKLQNNTPGTTNGVGSATVGAGQVSTIYDGNGKAISHVVGAGGSVGVGDLVSNLGAARAAAANADLTTLSSNIVAQTLQTLATELATAAQVAGMPGAGAWLTIVSASNWVKNLSGINPTIPGCSATVFLKA